MSAITNLPPVGSTGSSYAATASAAPGSVDKDQFLKLLVSQLKNQNPLDPITNENFIGQLAQFSSMEQQQKTNDSLNSLIQLQAATATMSNLTQASALLGKKIDYLDPATGNPASGVVSSIGLEQGAVVAKVGSTSIPLLLITGVQIQS